MNVFSVFVVVLSCLGFTLILVIRSLKKDLDSVRDELDEARLEIIGKKNELEVIRNVQKELKQSEEKKSPQKKESAPAGDSASRISRLNGVSDSSGK